MFFIYKYVNDQLGHSGKEDTPMDFHQTRGGQQFLYGTMPKLVKEIARLADAVENLNKLLEESNKETNR